ncbi:MAG: HIT domain-containing protein, partial [Acidiferrobacterales bacterium]
MRTDSECIFCKIVTGDVPCFKLYEDDQTIAFMDINPANEGHTLVIPKEHWEDVYAISPELLAATVQT